MDYFTEATNKLFEFAEHDPPLMPDEILQRMDQYAEGDQRAAISCLLHSSRCQHRLVALQIIDQLGDKGEYFLSEVIEMLNDVDRLIRVAALDPILRFNARSHVALPSLHSWLKSEDEVVRIKAASAIAKIDHSFQHPMSEMLIDHLDNHDREVRCHAAFELWGFETLDDESIQQIRRHENDPYIYVRLFVGEIIWKNCGDPSLLVDVATDYMLNDDEFSQTAGLEILRSIGPAAISARYLIRCMMDTANGHVQNTAETLLNEIE